MKRFCCCRPGVIAVDEAVIEGIKNQSLPNSLRAHARGLRRLRPRRQATPTTGVGGVTGDTTKQNLVLLMLNHHTGSGAWKFNVVEALDDGAIGLADTVEMELEVSALVDRFTGLSDGQVVFFAHSRINLLAAALSHDLVDLDVKLAQLLVQPLQGGAVGSEPVLFASDILKVG